MGNWFVTALLSFAALLLVASGPLVLWWATRRQPWSICKRLEHGRRRVRLQTSYTLPAWNPGQPIGPGNSPISIPGLATYRLTPDRLVVLEFVGSGGQREQLVGPLIERPAARRRTGKLLGAAWLMSATGAVVGGLIGLATNQTSTAGAVAGGAVIGSITVPLVMSIVGGMIRNRHRPMS